MIRRVGDGDKEVVLNDRGGRPREKMGGGWTGPWEGS